MRWYYTTTLLTGLCAEEGIGDTKPSVVPKFKNGTRLPCESLSRIMRRYSLVAHNAVHYQSGAMC